MIIGIRREDKNRWERRVPLTPTDLQDLCTQGLNFRIQPSPNRIFLDREYQAAGVEVAEDLGPCALVLAVKEIPIPLLERGKAYLYFSHVIKGQPYNMPMLARVLELGATLLDYERICDAQGRRLIFFSLHAGYAGMLDTLWALGKRLLACGIPTPLADLEQTCAYASFDEAKAALRAVGERLAERLPAELRPLVIGIAGYGNVAAGCREVLDCLPCEWIDPDDLVRLARRDPSAPVIRCVEFREEHLVRPIRGQAFDRQDYFDNPERYAGDFEPKLDHLDVLMNTIYWEPCYPRLVSRAWVARQTDPRLQAIGDISCDLEGSIEITLKATMPDQPCYTWDPETDTVVPGMDGRAPLVMAVDNLPCEVPRESSEHFSRVLRGMVPALAACDWSASFARLALPPELKGAVIAHRGVLTPDYRYLQEFLDA
ncbi:MAG: hypothetical protein R3D98_02940 [Candidatus Krumholzibacteriia bacterium]